mmetsp:Transcript_20802/g.48977  ORF Transcript_20802/g.48977 Transcript_20802/m.48977 type:complete len:84 (-) Transcript_20802:958-1209(-)
MEHQTMVSTKHTRLCVCKCIRLPNTNAVHKQRRRLFLSTWCCLERSLHIFVSLQLQIARIPPHLDVLQLNAAASGSNLRTRLR